MNIIGMKYNGSYLNGWLNLFNKSWSSSKDKLVEIIIIQSFYYLIIIYIYMNIREHFNKESFNKD